MPKTTDPRGRLEDAIAEEKKFQGETEHMYEALTAKMWAYQTRGGPAPTNEDFENWSRAVEERVRIKKMAIRLDGEPAN